MLAVFAIALSVPAPASETRVVVGSKKFTESYVLGEIAVRSLSGAGITAEHRPGMGGTIILWQALKSGSIGLYPEYTGTIAEEILKAPGETDPARMREALSRDGIAMTEPLGFNNTYALVMRRARARKLGIETISDLARHRDLAVGLTHEFLDRRDGWVPLSRRYGLAMTNVFGIDHGLGYAALQSGAVDVKDAYSTDAKIAEFDLAVLSDDRKFFPAYQAVFLYRRDLPPRAVAAIAKLSGSFDETLMTRLNAEAERTKDYVLAASLFFRAQEGPRAGAFRRTGLTRRIGKWTLRHLELTSISLLFAVLVGIPLGVWASRSRRAGPLIVGTAGMIQTVPALALLALLVPIPFLGIRSATAIVALFLYSLLPIIRNTSAGLLDIPRPIAESAEALGLSGRAKLFRIYLPMASRTILAGIKTSAVINVGTATLAALIGAGGLGEPILSGLNLNDHATILEGALPAAGLALLVEVLFGGLDRIFIPRGLRLPASSA